MEDQLRSAIQAAVIESMPAIMTRLPELIQTAQTGGSNVAPKDNELIEKLKENLNEFETTFSESLESSRGTLKRWRRETRALMSGLGELRLKRHSLPS